MFKKIAMTALASAAMAGALPAHAEDSAGPQSTAPAALAAQPPQPADEAALSNADLAQLRGGESVVVTNQTMEAITSGNVINGDYTAGNVTLSDSALSNFTGLGNVLINTGAQVSLQTGMNVTINVNQ